MFNDFIWLIVNIKFHKKLVKQDMAKTHQMDKKYNTPNGWEVEVLTFLTYSLKMI